MDLFFISPSKCLNISPNPISCVIVLIFLQFLYVIFLILLILVFPLFVIVFRSNQNRDQAISVYPIINHFYKSICALYLMVAILICINVWANSISHKVHKWLGYDFWLLSIGVSLYITTIYVHVLHIIFFLLAVQRFFLYFFLGSEPYVNIKEKGINIILYAIYVIFYLAPLVLILVLDRLIAKGFKISANDLTGQVYPIYYITLHILLFSSAFLYIPIVISIRKHSHLSTSMQNKPHKYILYQTVFIALFKIAHVILYWGFVLVENRDMSGALYITFCMLDCLSTPLIIQLTYLFCNKRNVETLRKKLSLRYITSRGSNHSQVGPIQEIDATTLEINNNN